MCAYGRVCECVCVSARASAFSIANFRHIFSTPQEQGLVLGAWRKSGVCVCGGQGTPTPQVRSCAQPPQRKDKAGTTVHRFYIACGFTSVSSEPTDAIRAFSCDGVCVCMCERECGGASVSVSVSVVCVCACVCVCVCVVVYM